MLDVFIDTSRLLSKKEAELQIAYWWVTWYARNHFLFKRKKLEPLISLAKAEAVVDAFRRYKKPEHQQIMIVHSDFNDKVNTSMEMNLITIPTIQIFNSDFSPF